MTSKFNVGDKVFHVGYGIGIVTFIYSDSIYAVEVCFETANRMDTFTTDGRMYEDHIMPSLLTLSEAKAKGYDVPQKKVKKWLWIYRVGPDYDVTTEHLTEQEAKERNGELLVQRIEETEIEVEE